MGLLWLLWQRELQALPRRPGHWRRRVAPVALGGLVLLTGAVWAAGLSGAAVGLQLLRAVATLLVLVVTVFAAPAAALSLWRERDGRTLEVLRLTDLPFGVLLLARWSLSFALALLGVLAFVPLVGLCLALGGLHWRQGVLIFLVLGSTLFLAVALGLLGAALAGTRRAMWVGVTFGQGLLFLLPWCWWSDDLQWGGRLTAFGALHLVIFAESDLSPVWCYQGLCLGLGVLLLAVAAWALPWRLRRPVHWRPGFLSRGRTAAAAPPMLSAEDPVVWFMFVHLYGGWRGVWRRFAVETAVLVTLIAGGIVTQVLQQGHRAETYVAGLGALVAGWLAIFFFGTVSGCGQAFDRLWADRGDELLLLTDLRESYYLWGVWRGIVNAFLPELYAGGIGALAVTALWGWVVMGDASADGAVMLVAAPCLAAVAGLYLYGIWRFCCMLALWYSLRRGTWGGLAAPAGAAIYLLLVLFLTTASACCAPLVIPVSIWLHLRWATAVLNHLGRQFDGFARHRLDRRA